MKLISKPEPPHQCEVVAASRDELERVAGGTILPGTVIQCDCGRRWKCVGEIHDRGLLEYSWTSAPSPHLYGEQANPPKDDGPHVGLSDGC